MNPVKYFTSSKKGQYIGTFVYEIRNGVPRFGWSRYNFNKEKADSVPFKKRVGRECAIKSTDKDIIIDTAKGYIHKGDTVIHDPEMVRVAMDFVAEMKRKYNKSPNNVKIHLSISYMKKIAHTVADRNEKLKKEIFELRSEKLQISFENGVLKDKIRKIQQLCTN